MSDDQIDDPFGRIDDIQSVQGGAVVVTSYDANNDITNGMVIRNIAILGENKNIIANLNVSFGDLTFITTAFISYILMDARMTNSLTELRTAGDEPFRGDMIERMNKIRSSAELALEEIKKFKFNILDSSTEEEI